MPQKLSLVNAVNIKHITSYMVANKKTILYHIKVHVNKPKHEFRVLLSLKANTADYLKG